MSCGRADLAFHDRKLGDTRRRDGRRRLDHHSDVEMLLEQSAGLNGFLAAAVDQDNAAALDIDQRNVRHRLGGCREKRRHLGSSLGAVARPPRGLAKIGVTDRTGPPILRRNIREKRRLLRAADGQSRRASRQSSEAVEFGAAKLPRGRHFFAATAAAHRASVERHRILARADNDVTRGACHRRRAHSAGAAPPTGWRSFAS